MAMSYEQKCKIEDARALAVEHRDQYNVTGHKKDEPEYLNKDRLMLGEKANETVR